MDNTIFISDTLYEICSNDCWNWIGSKDKDGYGIKRFNGKQGRAHRYSYTVSVGEIPDNVCVCHKCDNPSCVNPSHLFLGTISDNTQDMYNKGRGVDNRGEKNGKAKLTRSEVGLIKHILRTTTTRCEDIAKQFGVSRQAISSIKSGRNWSHV